MNYQNLRNELRAYYDTKSYENAEQFLKKCTGILEEKREATMSSFEMKVLQYKTIADECEPVLFEHSPFYYETGIIPGFSDGTRDYRGHRHAGGWTMWNNAEQFPDQDRELWELRKKQTGQLLYLICGAYRDESQHFQIHHRPIFEMGLKGVYEKAEQALKKAKDDKERMFLSAACEGLLCIRKISEKFAKKAQDLSKKFPQNPYYKRIAESAARCPWEKPQSFYEALNVYAFMRKVIGSLEGIGPNSFGRVDMDLYPFYEADLRSGVSEQEIYDLICRFLVTWDSHYDHDMKMEGYADHELENTYVLGGCDGEGKPLYNELTKLFLTAAGEESIIFPKIKCRFSQNSPKEYLDLINSSIVKGTTTVLYQNDDAVIPALIRAGRGEEDARDYLVSGCWDLDTNCNSCSDRACYINLLKVLEFEIHQPAQVMQECNMIFAPIDEAESFEEVYRITCDNINLLFRERTRVVTKGGQIWSRVDPLPVFSSLAKHCLDTKRDFTDCGTKYKDDNYMCVGFPNVVDSLLAIKTLCFDKKKYSLKELLAGVRSNWEGCEEMRKDALSCPGWGDGSVESEALAKKFHTSLYEMLSAIPGTYGGNINLGHMTYTEIRFWGEKTLATPDGRYAGDYFSQGLTPSRLKKIPHVTDVIHSMGALDKTELAGNNVINIILPGSTSLEHCEAFLRAAATTAVESLQLNCVSKETLLDAQKHPEQYPDLIVRVCGFSAKFTSLTPEWQQEVLTRNFYEG